MESSNSMENFEILEIDEEEVDWINPKRKVIKRLPDDIMNSIKHNSSNERILRKPNSDLILVYIGNKLFLFNSSNFKFVTEEIIEENEENRIINKNSLCTINFDKEIRRITINPLEPEFFCIIFEDFVKIYKFGDLLKYISNPITKILLTPALNYKIPSDKVKENLDAYVIDGNNYKLLINLRNQIILHMPPNHIISNRLSRTRIDHLLIIDNQIFLTGSEDELTFHLFNIDTKDFVELKRIKLKSILNSDQAKNDYRISYLTTAFKNILCVGIFEKEEESTWDKYSEIVQNFLFIDFSIQNQVILIKKIYKSEWVFNYNDDYEFKTAPNYQSVFYENYNVFILTSNQYHQAEIYYFEEDQDEMKIVKGLFEDDKRIYVPKNNRTGKMSLCEGIQIIDLKHESYEDEKITINSEEIFTPPLVLLVNDIGNLVVYYLPNNRDVKSVLKEKFPHPTMLRDKNYDFKYEENKLKTEITGNLFNNIDIKPPAKLDIPIDLVQQSPKISANKIDLPKESVETSKQILLKKEEKEQELLKKLKFEILQTNLTRQLDLYLNIISSYNLDIFELLKSLDKKINLSKSEKDLNSFIALCEKVCKEYFDLNKIIPDFKKYQEKISYLCSQKELIDKIAKDAERSNPDYLDIDKLILSHYDENESDDKIEILQCNDYFKKEIQIIFKKIEHLKNFLNDFKKFQNEFGEMSSINKKIKNNNKYEGIFKKFKSVSATNQQDNSIKSTGSNLTQFSTESHSSLYEIIMKKYEEIFINLDHRYYKELKPKINILNEQRKLYEDGRVNSTDGFSISDMDISNTYQKIKEDISYLGDNPRDNIFFHKMLIGKLSNILYNNIPKVVHVESKMKPKQNLEDFFLQDRKSKVNKGVDNKSSNEISIQSENYLMKVLDKVKKKKEERDKIKIDLDFNIQEFLKLEKNRISSVQNLKENKESKIVSSSSVNKIDGEKDKVKNALPSNSNLLQNEIKKNLSGANISLDKIKEENEKQKEKTEKEKKKIVDTKPFGAFSDVATNLFKNEDREKEKEKDKTFSFFNKPIESNKNLDLGSEKINLSENKPIFGLFANTTEPKTISITQNKSSTESNLNDKKILMAEKNKEIQQKTPEEKKLTLNLFATKDKEADKKTEPVSNIFGQKDNVIQKKSEDSKPLSNIFVAEDKDADKKQHDKKPSVNIFGANDSFSFKKSEEIKPATNLSGLNEDKKKVSVLSKIDEKPKEDQKKPTDLTDFSNKTLLQNFGAQPKLFDANPNNINGTNAQQSNLLNKSVVPNPDENKESQPLNLLSSTQTNSLVTNNLNKLPENNKQETKQNNLIDTSLAPNVLNLNKFNNISLSNNLFAPKTEKLNNPESIIIATPSNLPSNISNNPLNPINNKINQNANQSDDIMNKPAFGAKPNLGTINPLNNVAKTSSGNTTNIGSGFNSYGNTKTSSFSQFSNSNTGFLNFNQPKGQNAPSTYFNQQQNNMPQNPMNQQTTGFSSFQQSNNNSFLNNQINQPNQQISGFSNFQVNNNNSMSGVNNPLAMTFGPISNSMGGNMNNNFLNAGNNLGVSNNNNQAPQKNKNAPDYDLF